MIGTEIGSVTYNFWEKPGDLKHLTKQYAEQYISKEKKSIWDHIQMAFNVDQSTIKFDFTKMMELDQKTKGEVQAGTFFPTPDGEKADGRMEIHISHILIKPVSFIIFKRTYHVFVLAPKGWFTMTKKTKAYQHITVEEEVRYRSIASIKRNEEMINYCDVIPGCFGEKTHRYQKPEAFIRIRGADIYDIPVEDINEMNAAIKQMNSALEQHEMKGQFDPTSIKTNITVSPTFQVGQIGHDQSQSSVQDSVIQRSNL